MEKHITLILLVLVPISLLAQETIFVEAANQIGRGILRVRGDECFAIMPEHLLYDETSKEEHLGTVSVYGEGSVRAEAEKLKSYTSDLVILRFPDDHNLACTSWELDRDYQKVIDVVTKCKVEIREKTGGLATMAGSITNIDDQFLYIQPDNFRDNFAKGMSGASVFTEYNGRKVYLGMLQNIDGNSGEVLMADEMDKTLSEFFDPKKKIRRESPDSKVSLGVVRESGEYRFELLDMERSGSNLNLKFNVVSLKRDNNLQI